MTQILNLDEFQTPVDKTIVVNGNRHSFKPFSVGQFIDQLKEMETYSKGEEVPVSEYMEHMVKMVGAAFPTIPQSELRELTMEKLKAVSEFIQGKLQEDAALSAAAAASSDGAEGNPNGKSN